MTSALIYAGTCTSDLRGSPPSCSYLVPQAQDCYDAAPGLLYATATIDGEEVQECGRLVEISAGCAARAANRGSPHHPPPIASTATAIIPASLTRHK